MMLFRSFAMAGLMTCMALLTGCAANGTGYTTGGTYDESIRSVALPIFDNRTFYRELEFNLTEALAKEIEHRTPYKIAASGSADTQLTGTILSVDKRMISRTFETSVTQEAQMRVVASFEWKNLRTGEIIRKRGRLSGVAEYVVTQPVGETEQVARHAAVAELARELVSLMRSDW